MQMVEMLLFIGFAVMGFGIVAILSTLNKQTAILTEIDSRLARRWAE